MTYDQLAAHLPRAQDIGQAAIPMGMLLAWALNMQLLKPAVLQPFEKMATRVRMQDARGSELLVMMGGDLQRDWFTEQGQGFLDRFYPRYLDLYQSEFGEDGYGIEDNVMNYQRVAKRLTRAFLGRPQRASTGGIRSWWQRLWS